MECIVESPKMALQHGQLLAECIDLTRSLSESSNRDILNVETGAMSHYVPPVLVLICEWILTSTRFLLREQRLSRQGLPLVRLLALCLLQ